MVEKKEFFEKIPDLEDNDLLLVLNFAARLLVLKPNLDLTAERILETASDFSGNQDATLLLLDGGRNALVLCGVFRNRVYERCRQVVPVAGTSLEKVIQDKQHALLPQDVAASFPFPAALPHPQGQSCLCLPLAGTETRIVGVLVIGQPPLRPLEAGDLQRMMILATIGAMSIENTNLFHLATVDALTGLYVRVLFDLSLKEETARLRRYGGSVAVFILDIDHFKEINDRYGHQQGDAVLKDLAAIVRKNLREDVDIPCRYGGDEFIVLLRNTAAQEALTIVKRIQEACAGHMFSSGAYPMKIAVSVGVFVVGEGEIPDPEEIVRRADAMLYRAKNEGRNRICLWCGESFH
jgi:diguanylate cyclase (GGDEF)-like protein